ncbi:carbonic anhydrase 1-like [Bemisia tabaci]|uniref:carbonic anhydrase 1-like n=1 Tax=Bemisia tabaci TaxID=7038 RepID=UPI003B28DCC3
MHSLRDVDGIRLVILLLMIYEGGCQRVRGSMDGDLPGREPNVSIATVTTPPPPSTNEQSPIALAFRQSTPRQAPDLVFDGHFALREENEIVIRNNGETAMIGENAQNARAPVLRGGILEPLGDFLLAQCHFHWAPESFQGSEHEANRQKFSMESHFVHHNSKFGSVAEAQGKAGGIAVVGFFLRVVPDANPNQKFNLIVERVRQIQEFESEVIGTPDILTFAKDVAAPQNYFAYNGSLTTPPFSENVTWIVYPSEILITEEQVAPFRQLLHEDGVTPITSNWRELQPLNGRTVHFVSPPEEIQTVRKPSGSFLSNIYNRITSMMGRPSGIKETEAASAGK